MEPELIRDQRGGAVAVKFAEMTDEELRQRCWSFPEAFQEYLRRFIKQQQDKGLISKSG